MKEKSGTIKFEQIDKSEFERIKVEDTKVVDLSQLNDIKSSSIEDELVNLSRKELEYRLKFEETDPVIIGKIKKILELK